VTPTRDEKTTEKRRGPRRGRNAEVPARTNVTANITHGSDVAVDVSVLRTAADLIASQGEREAEAFHRGQLAGFAHGWQRGLASGLERGAA
jgi:hypothetical protein